MPSLFTILTKDRTLPTRWKTFFVTMKFASGVILLLAIVEFELAPKLSGGLPSDLFIGGLLGIGVYGIGKLTNVKWL